MRTMNAYIRVCIWTLSACLTGTSALAASTLSDDFARTHAAFDAAAARLTRDPPAAKPELARVAVAYERLATTSPLSDRSHAQALFNAGIAHQLAEQMGDAVLAYRRAQLADSSIPGLAANLAKARTQVSGQPNTADADDSSSRLQTMLSALDQWRSTLWATGLLALAATWAFLFLRLAARTLRFRVHAAFPIAAALIAIACAAAIGVPAWQARQSSQNAAIVMAETTPRAGPDPVLFAAAPTGPLKAGSEMVIDDTRTGADGRNWVKARVRNAQPDSQAFWLPQSAIALVALHTGVAPTPAPESPKPPI